MEVVLNFRRGYSYYLPDSSNSASWEDAIDETRKQFRDLFSNQIHCLTGVMPRLEFHADRNAYEMFYSSSDFDHTVGVAWAWGLKLNRLPSRVISLSSSLELRQSNHVNNMEQRWNLYQK